MSPARLLLEEFFQIRVSGDGMDLDQGVLSAVFRDVTVNGNGDDGIEAVSLERVTLAWRLTTDSGRPVANGVYLYRIQVFGPSGQIARSDIGKLVGFVDGVGRS